MRAWAIMAACFLPLLSIAASAEDADPPEKGDMTAAFEAFGFHETKKVDAGKCVVVGELNQKKFLESVPALQKLGVLNDELPKSSVRTQPFILSSAFLLQIIPIETKNLYDNEEKADKCSFSQALLVIDDYGNDMKMPATSYKFSRSLYKKINWDKFDSTKVTKVFPSFAVAPDLLAKMGEEKSAE